MNLPTTPATLRLTVPTSADAEHSTEMDILTRLCRPHPSRRENFSTGW
ncbi:hypothetical protein [Streptomyces sp. GESEQ-4]|nr:hypothetical protein [Streptomyces sp. GESEQ-4]